MFLPIIIYSSEHTRQTKRKPYFENLKQGELYLILQNKTNETQLFYFGQNLHKLIAIPVPPNKTAIRTISASLEKDKTLDFPFVLEPDEFTAKMSPHRPSCFLIAQYQPGQKIKYHYSRDRVSKK